MNTLAIAERPAAARQPADMDAAEWQLRTELAACYRIIDHLGWSELIYTHATVRVPGPEHHFLINPYGLRFDEVTASNLVKIDLEGQVIGRSDHGANAAGFVIHSAIHMGREDAQCVIHTHTTAGMAVSAQRDGLLPMHMYAHNYYKHIGYHDFEGPSLNLDERDRLARSLGPHDSMILRNHGLLVIGRTVAEAFVRMYRLERSCQVQLAAQSGGSALILPSDAACEESGRLTTQVLTDNGRVPLGKPEFDALVRLMDRKDASFRQ